LKKSVELSTKEFELLNDSSFFFAKKNIDAKLEELLIAYQTETETFFKGFEKQLPEGIKYKAKKVNKGQNYKGLPYWVVDLPSFFNQNDVFTYRVVVWWGNHISLSLIIGGKFYKHLAIETNELLNKGVYYSIHQSPWPLEFIPENLILIEENTLTVINDHFMRNDFIKLSTQFELTELSNLKEKAIEGFKMIIPTLSWRNI
jgi:hypothetical protein